MPEKLSIEELVAGSDQLGLKELAPLFGRLAERVHEHRQNNRGFAPPEIYASLVGLGGSYLCIEVIPRLIDSEDVIQGYLLKMRETGDQGWQGQYHIPGTSIRQTDG